MKTVKKDEMIQSITSILEERKKQIGWLSQDQIGWLSRDQIGWLSRDQIGGLSSAVLETIKKRLES